MPFAVMRGERVTDGVLASAWNGPTMNSGTATLHSYNESRFDEAEPRMGISVNERLAEDPALLTQYQF